MQTCQIVETKFFGQTIHTGFYSIQNNRIVAFYYRRAEKVEYFYNLSALKVQQHWDSTSLYDSQKKVRILVKQQIELDSIAPAELEESDKFYDFEPQGSNVYDEKVETPMSFKAGGLLRYFDE
ncbi:Hypothetical_protein [Hexamita inflata]|uniref:Hypothetical_protein n=1 Tax=Hexamita inflata TaxID=28002 RepID=A0AA86TYD4_9EUKA|nr:Hypothetical protein HINF_LOCUS22005 [Hexamita inflata]